MTASTTQPQYGRVWWSNSIFFVAVHVATAIGIYCYPIWAVPRATQILTIIGWHACMFGITIGYHRLYSHRAFKATAGVRFVLAVLGSGAMQGSIKWWALRHRLHHRWTDDPVHDPYAVTRGLLWSHMGWIFFQSNYERMGVIDRSDLDEDIIVQLQHKYFVPSALLVGFVLPVAIGSLWDDVWGSLVWAALFKAVFVWHCTFFINSVAHWDGLQPYSDDDTSRTNLILAILTDGEGNHNYHSFPYDYRSSPDWFGYDPSKWIIFGLHQLGLAHGLRKVDPVEIRAAMKYMSGKSEETNGDQRHHQHGTHSAETLKEKIMVDTHQSTNGILEIEKDIVVDLERKLPTWTLEETQAYAAAVPGRCVLVLQGLVVDVTAYMGKHPGGAKLLRQYSLKSTTTTGADVAGRSDSNSDENVNEQEQWKNATWAFEEGLNKHNLTSVRLMTTMAVATLDEGPVAA